MPESFRIGQTSSITKTITISEIRLFTGICCDFHPAHIDLNYVRSLGQNKQIVPETILVGLLNSVLKNKLPGENFHLIRQQVEYLHPAYEGETIKSLVEIKNWTPEKRLMTLRLTCINQENKEVIAGEAVMIFQG